MDCQTALEILDCVRPDSDDLDLPEMADARAHLESCDACQETFAKNQSFDRAVANVVQDVNVPDGLRSALPGTRNSRRRTVLRVVSAACVLMLGAATWLWQSQPVQFTEADLLRQLPIDLSATDQFDKGFEFALPAPWTVASTWTTKPDTTRLSLSSATRPRGTHRSAASSQRFPPVESRRCPNPAPLHRRMRSTSRRTAAARSSLSGERVTRFTSAWYSAAPPTWSKSSET
jgi:hypothetical protein